MIQQEIINAIERYVGNNYSIWTIGITANHERRRSEYSNPQHWHCWDATTESIARSIEKYFLNKGCKGDTGGGFYPTFVYIF